MGVIAAASVGGVLVRVVVMVMDVSVGVPMAVVMVPVIMVMMVVTVIVPAVMLMPIVVMMVVRMVRVIMIVRVGRSGCRLCPRGLDLRVEQPGTDHGDEPPAQGFEPGLGRFHGHAGGTEQHDQDADDHQRGETLEGGRKERECDAAADCLLIGEHIG